MNWYFIALIISAVLNVTGIIIHLCVLHVLHKLTTSTSKPTAAGVIKTAVAQGVAKASDIIQSINIPQLSGVINLVKEIVKKDDAPAPEPTTTEGE